MAKRKQSDIERDQARSQVSQWESQNGSLDDNQRATLQRMIELNSNTAEQDIRRADYYNGGSSKYDKDTQDVKIRNDNTGRLVTRKKETFSLKDGSEEPSLYDIYHNNEFDKNNRDNNVGINRVTNMLSQNRDTTGTTPVTPTSGPAFTTDNTSAARDRGGILGFLDRTLGRFSKKATDVFFPGVVDQQYDQLKKEGKDDPIWRESTSAPDNGFEKAADIAGTVFGYTAPVGASYKAVSKPIQLLTKGKELSTLGKVGVEALRGSSAGGVLGAGEAVRDELANPDEKNAQDHLKHIGTNALIGGIGDPAVMGMGKGIEKVLQAINKDKAFAQLSHVVGDKNAPLESKVDYVPTSARNEVNADKTYDSVMKRSNSNSTFDNLIQNAEKAKEPAQSAPFNVLNQAISPIKQVEGNLDEAVQSVAKQNKTSVSDSALPDGVQAMRSAAPVLQTAAQTEGQTITHQQLLDSIKNNLGVTIRHGRMGVGDDAVQGIYKTNPEVIRTKDYGDLETISHEIGHHFDKQYKLNDPQFDNELMKLGAHTSAPNYTPEQVREEGVGEFMRRYLLNPQMAKQEAPKFFERFHNVIPEELQKGFQKVQGDTQIWANQGDAARLSGKIADFEQPKGLARIKQMFQNAPQTGEKFYTEAVDRLFPIAKAEKEILGGKLADASESAYKKARLAAGTPRIAEQKLDELRGILKPLDNSQYKMQDIRDYMTAMHAQDLEKQGIKTGFTPDEIQATLKKYENSGEIKDMQQSIVKYNNSLLDKLVESQVLSKDAVDAMRAKHPNYVPFFRHFDEESTAGLGGKGFVDLTNPVKRMTGSSRNVINPIESMIKNTFAVTQAAEKNKVGLALANLAKKDGNGNLIERLNGKESVRNENIVTVFENGEKVQYQLAPELYSAVKALDKEVTNKFALALGKPSDWLRAGATLTPEFALRNPIRDQFNAIVTSDVGYNPLDFFKGLKEVGKKHLGKESAVYDDWVKQGGAYGGYLSSDRNILNEQLQSFSKEGTKLQRAAQTLKNPKEWLTPLQKLSEISEEATKVGAYQKGLKKGLTPEESAYQARDLMDFNRMGNSVQAANRILTFLNANVQGKDKLVRALKENTGRTLWRIAGTTVPPSALAYASYEMANDKQKEILDNMPQWERDTYWAFAVPGTDEVARVPKPFDISLLANTAERTANKFAKGDNYAFEGYGNTVKDAVKMPFIPTVLQPVVENMSNHSFFTDGPIVPQRDQSNSPRNQYGPTTSLTAREIGDALNVSPYKVDNLYKGYTAGLGQYPLKGLDAAISLISNKEKPTQPAQSFTESAPGIRAFFSNDQGGGKVMDDYYNVSEQQKAIEADAEDNGQEAPNKAEMKAFNKVNKQMSKVRKEYREVQQDTKMDPNTKRSEMDRLNKEMREIARQGIQIFRPDYK